MKIKIEKTGRAFSIASNEFIATFPDGTQETFWSPIWHDFTEEEETDKAIEYAIRLWENRKELSDGTKT